MNKNIRLKQMDELERAVIAAIGLDPIEQDSLVKKVVALQPALAPDISAEEIKRIIALVEAQVIVIIEGGTVLQSGEHEHWLTSERKAKIDWKRWLAYRALLQHSKMPLRVIDEMGQRSDLILGLIGDPLIDGSWQRRGLVIGDVQSGKTANYLGLFNKAADAGYKVIILLGGHTDKLRKQTQIRVDEGFVGKDSRRLGKGLKDLAANIHVGVGLKGVTAAGFTTVNSDFSAKQLTGLNLEMESMSAPVIFVIKKNKPIIDNLVAWLNGQASKSGKLSMPMLLLDDEADYASINTNNPEEDPTAINQGIRDLLGKFEKNAFVGFTATPYANVLIDDEAEDDLFPRDFIYALEAPSNYFGPEQMFAGDDDNPTFLRPIFDAEELVPFKHKSTFEVQALPESLKASIRAFMITNAIRDSRGQSEKPRSMLINVSRYNLPQQSVVDLVGDYVSNLREAITYSNSDSKDTWNLFENTWDEEFESGPEKWGEIKLLLPEAIKDIVVRLVNSKNKTDDWDKVYDSDRARVIAVGGDVLSRGLTLEGLSTSYFYRKSVAYDTLMQMGRWFGYRAGYQDICRLWIDQEVSTWYAFIATAIKELREDLRSMRNANLTPRDFGLAVRRHPGSVLTVTALNKAKHAQISRKISLRNYSAETPRLPADQKVLADNWSAFEKLVKGIRADGIADGTSLSGHPLWRGVSPKRIVELLEVFKAGDSEMLFTDGVILSHVSSTKASWMQKWDVMVMGGNSNTSLPLINNSQKLVTRAIYENSGTLFIGGEKMRLGGRGDISQVLTKSQKDLVAQEAAPKEPSDNSYRMHLKNPLLIIYPIEPKTLRSLQASKRKKPKLEKLYVPAPSDPPVVGLHFSFPVGDADIEEGETVTYLVNKVYARNNQLYEDATELDGDD